MIKLSQVRRAYPNLSWRDQLHIAGRWWLCPLNRIALYIPRDGVVVDLGCGHGVFSCLLALESSQRQIIGIDLDTRKIDIARQVKLPNLGYEVGDIAEIEIPPVQAVAILDVFYLISYEAQERLLKACAEKLAPGGVIILKDMAETPRWKVRLNWLQEFLAVRVLRITLGNTFYFRTRAEWQKLFQQLGFEVEMIALDHWYYHPHVLFVARKPSS